MKILMIGLALAAAGTAAPTLIDIEDESAGFRAMSASSEGLKPDSGGAISYEAPPAGGAAGSRALKFSYSAAGESLPLLVRPGGLPPGAGEIGLSLFSRRRGLFMLALRSGNHDYRIQFALVPGAWRRLQAPLSAFAAEPGAPPLDPGKVDALSLVDVEAFAHQSLRGGEIPFAPIPSDPRELWIDRLTFAPAPPAPPAGGRGAAPMTFGSAPAWLVLELSGVGKGPQVTLWPERATVEEAPEAGPGAIAFSYPREAGQVTLLHRSLEAMTLTGLNRLKIRLRLSRPSLLLIQLKERDGSEYQFPLIPAGQETGWRTLSLNLAPSGDFGLAEHGKDENNRLDLDQIREITIIDPGPFGTAEAGPVRLELAEMTFAGPAEG